MLSGIWPRGSNSAPGSGNTAISSGSSLGPRYSALIGISAQSLHGEARNETRNLREQDGRQPLAAFNGGFIRPAPGLEELHELLARAVIVPFAIAPDDLEQLAGGLAALAAGIQRGRQVESGLMVDRICGDFLFQLGDRAERLGLLVKIDRSLHRLDRGVVAF